MRNYIRLTLAVGALVCSLCPAQASEPSLVSGARNTAPHLNWTASDLVDAAPHRLYFKMAEGTEAVEFAPNEFRGTTGEFLLLNQVLAQHSVDAKSTFSYDREQTAAWKHDGELRAGVVGPDLSLWFTVQFDGTSTEFARLLNDLNDLEAVEIAHPSPRIGSAVITSEVEGVGAAPLAQGGTPDYTSFQDYLFDSPIGLNAPAIWSEPGGTGTGMRFIDVEGGWTVDHEDFNVDNLFFQGGTDEDFGLSHGTAVLGEVVGQPNGFGIRGFAPDVEYGTEALDLDDYPDVSLYFQEAVDNLRYGDVWLIELQMFPSGFDATPMEYLQVNFDVIWTSVFARGVLCVEAGANGSENLDQAAYGGLFDLDVRDSGAILVGAGTPFGLVAESFTNYGSRIDCHAWGSSIYTTGYGDLYNEGPETTHYTSGFGGTSGASPMIVGSALCLQGVAREALGEPAHPLRIREILRTTGTPHNDSSKEIGPRPNLAEALAELVSTASTPPPDRSSRLQFSARPNPTYGATRLLFVLEEEQAVELTGFDVKGREVAQIFSSRLPAGSHSIPWALDEQASQAGVIYVQLRVDGKKEGVVPVRSIH